MSAPSDDTRFYDISTLAIEEQISLRTLRFYEEKGLIAPARDGNRRTYSPADRIKLQLILKGRRLGFTLEQIRQLILGSNAHALRPSEPDAAALLSPETIRAQIAALERQRHGVCEAIETLRASLGAKAPGAADGAA